MGNKCSCEETIDESYDPYADAKKNNGENRLKFKQHEFEKFCAYLKKGKNI